MFLRTVLNRYLCASLLLVAPAHLDPMQEPAAKRLAAIVSVAVEEYAKGIDANGRIIAASELDEAAGFLRDAKEIAQKLDGPTAPAARLVLDSLIAAATRHAMPAELAALNKKFAEALGAEGAIDLPARLPDLLRAKQLFTQNCVACHGVTGAGDGPRAADFKPHPEPIGSAAEMHGVSPAHMYRVISVGVQGTTMSAWSSVLSVDDRWALVAYVNALRATDQSRAHGAGVLHAHCPSCASAAPPQSRSLLWQTEQSDDAIAALIAAGDPLTGISDGASLTGVERADAVAALRATPVLGGFAAPKTAAAATGDSLDTREAARHVVRLIGDALAAARAGRKSDAGDLAFDAYIAFEPLEGPARMRDPGLVAGMERHFADFKGAVKANDLAAAELERNRIEQGMPAILELEIPDSTGWGVFLESLLIILREGFEAILVVGAVVAFLIKTGNRARLRDIWWGVTAGLAASVILAFFLKTALAAVPASQDVIEGVTLLFAVVVLFSVSYWLLSKVEAAQWQKFIREKVNDALSHGGRFALGFVAFLAVFREGAETALFYQALFTRGTHNTMPVAMGLLVGAAALAVIFSLFYRFGVKIPLRPFFAVTSALLYTMAFVFAGKGLKELQEGNIVSQTLIPGFPHIEFFGIYPTVETLTAQGLLLGLLLFALWRTLAPAAADPAGDEDPEFSGEAIPPELAARLIDLQATARRLQDRVDSLEKEIEHDAKTHGHDGPPA
jgi:high-affinity iron transporter